MQNILACLVNERVGVFAARELIILVATDQADRAACVARVDYRVLAVSGSNADILCARADYYLPERRFNVLIINGETVCASREGRRSCLLLVVEHARIREHHLLIGIALAGRLMNHDFGALRTRQGDKAVRAASSFERQRNFAVINREGTD